MHGPSYHNHATVRGLQNNPSPNHSSFPTPLQLTSFNPPPPLPSAIQANKPQPSSTRQHDAAPLHGPAYHDRATVSYLQTTPSLNLPLFQSPLQLTPSLPIPLNRVVLNNQRSASPPRHHDVATPQPTAASHQNAATPQHAAVAPLHASPTRIVLESPSSTQCNNNP